MKVDTIRIEHEGFPDGVVINASDFNPETHVEWEREPDVEAPAPVDADAEAEEAFAGDDEPVGYRVEESRGWYKLIGPDGEQVGKSVRSEDEAWAQMEDEG